MTKYILIGGFPRKAADAGKTLCEEIVKGFGRPVKILDCLFARPEETWREVFAEDRKFFAAHLPGKDLEIELANLEKFTEQVIWANVIYLRGGYTEQLIRLLNQNKDWIKRLDGKTLAGTSAGADAIAKYYYGLDDLKIGEGLGLLPIKVIVHYRSDYNAPNVDWDKAYSALKSYKEKLSMLTLKEGEFQIITR